MSRTPHHYYHVLIGLAGLYMPNENEYHTSRRSAEASAAWHAASFRDDGTKVSGSARQGYYSVGEYESIEIHECSEPDCHEED